MGYGKYYWHAAYEKNFIETEQLADFIQTQASIKKSDIKATLDELGAAMKHFFEMGQKIRLDGIGIFKVGISSKGQEDVTKTSVEDIMSCRVLFQPETETVRSITRSGSSGTRFMTAGFTVMRSRRMRPSGTSSANFRQPMRTAR